MTYEDTKLAAVCPYLISIPVKYYNDGSLLNEPFGLSIEIYQARPFITDFKIGLSDTNKESVVRMTIH